MASTEAHTPCGVELPCCQGTGVAENSLSEARTPVEGTSSSGSCSSSYSSVSELLSWVRRALVSPSSAPGLVLRLLGRFDSKVLLEMRPGLEASERARKRLKGRAGGQGGQGGREVCVCALAEL